jgi:hypothetical protein
MGFCLNVDARLVHQVKNGLRTYHHSDHDPLIFEIKARVKRTYKIVNSKN